MRHVRPPLFWSVVATHRPGFGWGGGSRNNNNNNSNNSNNNNNNNNNNNFSNTASNNGGGPVAMTEFASRASALKRRHRGRGQYEFARREAEKFLEAEVPRHATNMWMEEGTNALALSQLLNFFEIEPDAALLSLITNRLVRIIDDAGMDGHTRLNAAVALSARGEQYTDHIFRAVEDVLRETTRDYMNDFNNNNNNNSTSALGGGSNSASDVAHTWNIIDLSSKVMQRNGKHAPNVLVESLAQLAMAQLERTPVTELAHVQLSLLRVYSWMVRVGKVTEANHLLIALVEHTGDFYGYDFATLMNSCLRHHQLSPLPLSLLHRMARVGLMYSTTANGRDVASILASFARMLGSLEAGKNGITQRDVGELAGRMSMLLEEYEPRVLRFMDSSDKLYWTHCDDVTSVVFAYEMGGRLRYRHVFIAYQNYVAQNVTRFETQQLAMSSGILRRSYLLSRELAVKLSERIETVLGEFTLSEISHICATFAPMAPAWMPEAKAVATRLLTSECSSHTKLTLAMAFPEDDVLHSQINYKEISGRQLVDAMTLAKGIRFEAVIVAELTSRLNAAQERFSPDDLRMIQASGRQDLSTACMMYLSSRFAEAEWTADTLYSLPLSSGIPHARDPVKALAAAKAVSISPEQFVSLVELLTGVFGEDSDASMVNFVVTGGLELLGEKKIQWGTVLRYLEAVRLFRKMHPNSEWLALFNEKILTYLHSMRARELRSLLWSLHDVYGNVAQQPLLQQVLTEVVGGAYSHMQQPDEEAAHITVLIAQMQHGMRCPPLTTSTALVAAVQNNAAAYPAELREAVVKMTLPREAETRRVGRFTLRALGATTATDVAAAPQSQDVNAALDVDPFATPSQTSANDAAPMQQSPPSEAPAHVFSAPAAAATFTRDVPPAQMVNTMPQESTAEVQENNSNNNNNNNNNAGSAATNSVPGFAANGNTNPEPSTVSATLPSATAQGGAAAATTTSSPQSGSRLWNLFGTSTTTDMAQREPAAPVPPVIPAKPSEETRPAADSHTGSLYMKMFHPRGFSNVWPHSQQEELHTEEASQNSPVKNSDNAEEQQLRPRRTNLPKINAHKFTVGTNTTTTTTASSSPSAAAAAQPAFGYETPEFRYDGWNTQPNTANTPANTPATSLWSSSWSASKPSVGPTQGNSMAGRSTPPPWLTMHMQTPTRTFGGSENVFGVSNPQQQLHQQAPSPVPAGNIPMMHQQHQHQQQQQQQHLLHQQASPPASQVNASMMQQQQPQQQQQQQRAAPLPFRMSPQGGMATPGNHLFVDPASSPRSRPVITKKNPPVKGQQASMASSSLDEDINQMFAKNPNGANEGASNFMKKTGITKITGYNMNLTDADGSVGDRKGFWSDVINQSVKRPKGESRRSSKKANTLSEWLDTPPKHAVTTSRKGHAASPPAAAAKGGASKEKRGGSGGGNEHAAAATATTTVAKGAHAARGKGANTKSSPPPKTSRGVSAKAPAGKTPAKGAAKPTPKPAPGKVKKQPDSKKMAKKKPEKKAPPKKTSPAAASAVANAKNKNAKKAKSSGSRRK